MKQEAGSASPPARGSSNATAGELRELGGGVASGAGQRQAGLGGGLT